MAFWCCPNSADFLYKTTDYYAPQWDRGVRWDDPAIGVHWPLDGAPDVVGQGPGAAAAAGRRGLPMNRSAPRSAHRILLTGANGQVGWELRRTLASLGEVVALDSRALNLADADAVRRTVREIAPAIIVNPAAYTAVDKAESEQELAHAVNAVAPGVLAEEAARLDALLVHYSTDYVFNGSGDHAVARRRCLRPAQRLRRDQAGRRARDRAPAAAAI